MDKYIGKKLEGRYEILELIGFGGMAIVFKARDLLQGKFVAVKILKDEFLANDDFKRRFRNESKAIAVLSHPSIVKIIDVNFSDNIQYIVMEHIDGITLKEYIEQQGAIKWKEAVHFTVQILRALQHAHDNGIVHRDVKPQNVMLLEDGTIKVMDFGIARFARENGKTMSDKAIGSVHYISPEQAKGDMTDEKTDIYATGVMMYEMLTGKVPFDGDTAVSIAIKQMQIEPKNPRSVNPDIPVGLEEIILRAMQKDPQLRYQTAAEMLRDIDEFKRNPSVVFEYRYFNSDGTTKYFDKVDVKNIAAPIEIEKPVRKSYVMNILAGVTAACVLLAIFALYIFFKSLDNTPKDVMTIAISGMTVEEAKVKMPNVEIVVSSEELSTEYEKGIILKQRPEAGTKVKINTQVQVVVSLGLEAIVIPDLVNETAAIAKSKLESLGLVVQQVQKTDDIITAGHVIMTDPPAETEMEKGDQINLYVSLGAMDMPEVVPDLRGITEIEARSKLAPLGLSIGTVTSIESIEPAGTIIEQNPAPKDRVEKGTKINIGVSTGVPASSDPIDPSNPGVQSGTNITIDFAGQSALNQEFTFIVVINSQNYDVRLINPAIGDKISLALTVRDGLINQSVAEQAINDVTVMLDGHIFANYTVDFATGTVTTVTPPNYPLMFAAPPPPPPPPESDVVL